MGKGKRDEWTKTAASWHDLVGKVAPEVLNAPKTVGDTNGEWPGVHERLVRYLLRHVVGTPWEDHLTLIIAVLSARRRDVWTIQSIVEPLHHRFSDLFTELDLKTMDEWNADQHLLRYLKGEVVTKDSQSIRQTFLRRYTSATKQLWHWLGSLPAPEQDIYRPFLLPLANPLVLEGWNKRREIEDQQQKNRKNETEAIVPYFAEIRAEAHFRYNRLMRLYQAYQRARESVLPDHSNLPLEFSYEEGEPPTERFHFKLWDRRTFALDPEHKYSDYKRKEALRGKRTFSSEHTEIFMELLKVESLDGNAAPEGFWFTDILRLGLLGLGPRRAKEQEMLSQQAWLRQWGYGDENLPQERSTPFFSGIAGLLSWSDERKNKSISVGEFISGAQNHTEGVLIPVESFYAAATFGLLALDLLTTTGMRANELMQVSVLPECIVRLVDDPPPGARDQSPRIRYILRLLPKGERTETRHQYGVGIESMRLIERTAQMLCEHYQLLPGEPLPRVAFDPTHSRSHRFEGMLVPYIFQYSHRHLPDNAIAACLRFLLHGMIFQTSEGAPVVIKPHLLRHAFATFAVQVEKMPIDLVAEWLKQKNLATTQYYSQKGEQEVAEKHSSFVARLATQINVREAILRSPQELQKQAETAMKRVGMLVPVCGGDCTIDVYCPNQYDCIHCPAKVPDPEKRSQVEEKRRWAEERLAYYEREGLVLESEKMRQLIRACDLELREMNLILTYRKDAERAALIQIEPRKHRP